MYVKGKYRYTYQPKNIAATFGRIPHTNRTIRKDKDLKQIKHSSGFEGWVGCLRRVDAVYITTPSGALLM